MFLFCIYVCDYLVVFVGFVTLCLKCPLDFANKGKLLFLRHPLIGRYKKMFLDFKSFAKCSHVKKHLS